MVPRASIANAPPPPLAEANRRRHAAHHERIARRARERTALLASIKQLAHSAGSS
jgi:hypothetical protein